MNQVPGLLHRNFQSTEWSDEVAESEIVCNEYAARQCFDNLCRRSKQAFEADANTGSRLNLRHQMRHTRRLHATASSRPQVVLVACSRNQVKARCLNEIAGFPFPDMNSENGSGLHLGYGTAPLN
jgi:hypothetical protein